MSSGKIECEKKFLWHENCCMQTLCQTGGHAILAGRGARLPKWQSALFVGGAARF
jgi:hypothetical protein